MFKIRKEFFFILGVAVLFLAIPIITYGQSSPSPSPSPSTSPSPSPSPNFVENLALDRVRALMNTMFEGSGLPEGARFYDFDAGLTVFYTVPPSTRIIRLENPAKNAVFQKLEDLKDVLRRQSENTWTTPMLPVNIQGTTVTFADQHFAVGNITLYQAVLYSIHKGFVSLYTLPLSKSSPSPSPSPSNSVIGQVISAAMLNTYTRDILIRDGINASPSPSPSPSKSPAP